VERAVLERLRSIHGGSDQNGQGFSGRVPH
jgi:hypothetical protein